MGINELLAEKVRVDGKFLVNEPALVLFKKDGGKVEYSWFEYEEKVLQTVEGLKGRNLKPGEFVAIIALNLPESFFAMLGAILMGAIPVPINYLLLKNEGGKEELKKILNDCRPSLVLVNQSLKKMLPKPESGDCIPIEQIIQEGKEALAGRPAGKNDRPESRHLSIPVSLRKPQEMLIMPYTSGTTGIPKGVMLSEEGVLDRVAAILGYYRASHRERVPSYLPLGHISELIATFFGQLYGGYTVYFTEHIEKRLTDPEKLLELFSLFLQQVKATIFLGVPNVWINFQNGIKKKLNGIPVVGQMVAQLRKFKPFNRLIIKMVKTKLGLLYMRIAVTAAAPPDQIDMALYQNLDIFIDDIYGQTEVAGPILINGQPLGNVQVWIGSQNNGITVEGPCIMLGYYNHPEATAEVIQEVTLASGETRRVYLTGDLGRKGADGRIFYDGRQNEGGKGGNGEYYSASKLFELEKEIKKIKGIEEVIFVFEGRPFLTALIFHQSDANQIPVKAFVDIYQCLDRIGEGFYKVKGFRVLSKKELILTPTMKVKKKAVMEKFKTRIDQMYEE